MARRRKKNPYAGIGSTLGGVGASAAGAGGKKGSRKKQSHANVGAALGGVGSSASAAGHGFKHAAKHERNRAVSAVTKYAAGTKGAKPTIAQVNTAWPHLPEDVRKIVAPAIIQRAWSESDPTASGISLKTHATKPLPKVLRKYAPKAFDAYNQRLESVKQGPINAGDPPIPGGSIIRGAVSLGEAGATAARATSAATKTGETAAAGEKAAKTESVAARVGEGTTSQGSRIGAEVGEQAAQRGAKLRSLKLAAAQGIKDSRVARTARIASQTKTGRTALYFGKRPVRTVAGASLAAQTPAAISQFHQDGIEGALVQLGKPFTEGSGVVPDLLKAARDPLSHLGVVGNAVADIMELPAVAVPSVYMLGKAAVDTAQGDTVLDKNGDTVSPLKAYWDQYVEKGFIPGAVEGVSTGNFDQALEALQKHPIYSLLEVSGAKSAAGRTAGAAMRSGALGERAAKVASTERPPLEMGGNQPPYIREPYSKDVIRQHWPRVGQKAKDRRRVHTKDGRPVATAGETDRILKERQDSIMYGDEQKRRHDLTDATNTVESARPRGEIDAAGVRLAVMKKLRSVRSFQEDIQKMKDDLDREYANLQAAARGGDGSVEALKAAGVAKAKLEPNRELRSFLDDLAKHGNPEVIMESASHVADFRNSVIDPNLERLGMLDHNQGRMAAMVPAARQHLGVRHEIPAAQVKAWEEYGAKQAELAKIEKALLDGDIRGEGALRALRARRKELKAETKTAPPKPAEQFVDAQGNPIGPDKLAAELKAVGAEGAAFTSLRPRQSARAAGYVPSNERPTLPKAATTGKAADQGAFDYSYDALTNEIRQQQGKISAGDAWDGKVREASVAPEIVSKAKNGYEAQAMASNPEAYGIERPVGQGLRVIRTHPYLAREREGARAGELQAKPTQEATLPEGEPAAQAALREMWTEANDLNGPGPFALIPDSTWLRWQDHYKYRGAGTRAMQMFNQVFKKNVLATKPKWLGGNFVSINLRAILGGELPLGLGIRKRRLGNAVEAAQHELDPITARRNSHIIGKGTLGTSTAEQQMYITAAQDISNTGAGRLIHLGAAVKRAPVIRSAVGGWNAFVNGVFKANNALIEHPVLEQFYGKALLRELDTITRVKWAVGLKKTSEIADDLAKGTIDLNKTIELAKYVEKFVGQWGRNSPTARWILTTYAPFGMWTRAVVKYIYWTLPVDHPIKTAIAANIELMTEDERKALGLSIFADRPAPAGLRSGIPLSDGGIMPTSSYSEFGYASDITGNISNALFPQASGFTNAFAGFDPFGRPLEHDDGTPLSDGERLLAGTVQFLGVGLPLFGQATQIAGWDAAGVKGADSFVEGLKKQVPFTNANNLEPGIVEYLRNRETYPTYEVQDTGSSSSSSTSSTSSSSSGTTLPPWYGGSSSSSSSGTSLPPWYGK